MALNFANKEEALSFRNAVIDKIQIRQRRRDTTSEFHLQNILFILLC